MHLTLQKQQPQSANFAKRKLEIIDISTKIGTFDISIEPYEDCCTVFTPKHPRTKPQLEKVLVEENKLDFKALADEAIAGAYTIRAEAY